MSWSYDPTKQPSSSHAEPGTVLTAEPESPSSPVPSTRPPDRNRIGIVVAAVVAAAVVIRVVGLGGHDSLGGSSEISLLAADLPLEYSSAEFSTGVTEDCLIANRIERVSDADLGGAAYESPEAGSRIRLLTIRTAEAPALFTDLRELISQCEPSVSASSSGTIFLMDRTEREVVDGPAVGDESFWIATDTEISHTGSSAPQPDPLPASHSVIYRVGDQVAWLSVGLENDKGIVHDLAQRTLK